MPNPLRYNAREFDTATGLYYYRARWYDPAVHRFLSEDPAAEGTNLYAYVSNDPVNYTDPTGMYQQPTHPCAKNPQACRLPTIRIFANAGGWTINIFWPSSRNTPGAGAHVEYGGTEQSGRSETSRIPGVPDGVEQAWEGVREWNKCVATATNANFQETNKTIWGSAETLGSRVIGGLVVNGVAAHFVGDSGLLSDTYHYLRNNHGRKLSTGRVWISRVGGKYLIGRNGRRALLVRVGLRSATTAASFTAGIGLGSAGVGIAECT